MEQSEHQAVLLAKVLAASLGARLIRLQCYEGLDVNTAVYEWNYPRQMLEIRLLVTHLSRPAIGEIINLFILTRSCGDFE